MPDVSIISPTFHEAPNIPTLVDRVFAATASASLDAELILVDDDSRDGTAAVVDRLARQFPVRLVVRTERPDLSRAVLAGFAHARAEVFVVIDADLSHPPEAVPRLVKPVAAGLADMSLGSRYIPGGRTENWSLRRLLASRCAAAPARLLVRVSDPLSGFFCLTRRILHRAGGIEVSGYKIALELMIRARPLRIVEVPITFSERKFGSSKLGPRQQWQYLRQLWRLHRGLR
jgi:dolichol-phosphate mannosyltransferase